MNILKSIFLLFEITVTYTHRSLFLNWLLNHVSDGKLTNPPSFMHFFRQNKLMNLRVVLNKTSDLGLHCFELNCAINTLSDVCWMANIELYPNVLIYMSIFYQLRFNSLKLRFHHLQEPSIATKLEIFHAISLCPGLEIVNVLQSVLSDIFKNENY